MNARLRHKHDEELFLALTKRPAALAYEPFRRAPGLSRPRLYCPKMT
jgi:hypothetical protein